MIDKFSRTGMRFWSIKPNVEAESYGDNQPREPWQGVVTKDLGDRVKLNRFDEDGDPDDDPNAFAIVGIDELFATREEAEPQFALCSERYYRLLLEDVPDEVIRNEYEKRFCGERTNENCNR